MADISIKSTEYNRMLGDDPPSSTFASIRDGTNVGVYALSGPNYYAGAMDVYTASPTLFRLFISFDLTPYADLFTGVQLKLFVFDRAVTAKKVYLIQGFQSSGVIPTVANWISENALTENAANILGELTKSATTEGVYYTMTLNATGIAYVKSMLGGECPLCLLSEDDFDNMLVDSAHDETFFTHLSQATGKEPTLVLTDYVLANKNFGVLLD